MTGARPVVDLMFGDFSLSGDGPALQPGGQAALTCRRKLTVPMVLRTNMGATRRSAAQHSQSLQALVRIFRGSRCGCPLSAYEAKGADEDRDPGQQPGRDLEDKLM